MRAEKNEMNRRYLEYLKRRYNCRIWEFFGSDREKLIYGKGAQARVVYEACQLLGIQIAAFVSTKEEVFSGSARHEKNYTIDDLPEIYADSDILVAVNEKWNDEIRDALNKRGFLHIHTMPEWETINRLFQTYLFQYMVTQGREGAAGYDGGIIRFCDGPEERIYLEEYTRESLLEKIAGEKSENVLFHVYDKNEIWQGTLQFGDLLVCGEDWTQNICREKILFDCNVFDSCNAFFARYPWRIFVPVYRKDNTVACMAWLERPEPRGVFNSQMYTVDNLKTVSKEDAARFFVDVNEVCLYGVNEISYQIYAILKEKHIPYRIVGERWKFLGDDVYREEMEKPYTAKDFQRLNVYAEAPYIFPPGKENEQFYDRGKVLWNYEWLNTLSKLTCSRIADQMIRRLHCNGVATALITFPETRHLQKVTEEETYDSQRSLNLHRIGATGMWRDRYEKIYTADTIEKYLAGKQCEGRFYKSRFNLTEWAVTDEERRNNIYIIGPCVAAQTDLPTEYTMVAQIQKKVDEEQPGQYKVCGISVDMNMHFQYIEKIIDSIDFFEGDLCLFIFDMTGYKSRYEVPLDKLFDRRKERWFADTPIHVNEIGSGKVAEYIFENCVKPNLKSTDEGKIAIYASELDVNEQAGIKEYVDEYRDYIKRGKCGCIVMNCNPYTYGHDFLIEMASKQVDWLYIFVVEEDKSYFPFADRFELVRKNTQKYHNVIVLPSGKMILSAETMPSYFMKETHQEAKVDATKDLRLFCLGIAPIFGITVRFVGQEPIDKVTAQYNMEMKKRLPHYGIELVEVARKHLGGGGTVISASKVRQHLKNNEMEDIREYVPPCTWDYLMNFVSVINTEGSDK